MMGTDISYCSPIMGWNAHDGEVIAVEFSMDETQIFSLGTDGKVIDIACKFVLISCR